MTPEPSDPAAEIAAVAREIEALAASHDGSLAMTLKLCARRLRVALLLRARGPLRAL